ncbi:LCP family protein [Canibacter oris]|uniref:LCP family protein required for cell wall assembly n=1 Tax=Canibacter oris TaxID=1365628 RepID=A0A840DPF3_9MICO|nr:LCP family protein [Canibacter oris]MBB4071429.1 LCP family protein required for cell wall assembly [Canibacter oris]
MAQRAAKAAGRKTTVRHGKLRRSSALANFVKTLVAMFTVAVLSGISIAAYALLDLTNNVTSVNIGTAPRDENEKANANQIVGDINILLVGSDTRQGQSLNDGEEGELNDVTLMLRISADHKQATVVSFPRDMVVDVPSCPGPNGEPDFYPAQGEQQFNSTLQNGLGCVVRTVENLTGASIPHAGIITFDGVINMSNAIGGVDVCLTQPIYDPNTDLDLPAGDVTLVGVTALQFLRTRYGVGDGGDQSRISNQQVFMSAMLRKIKSAQTLSDPGKVYGLAKAAVENMILSQDMASVQFMQSFASTVKDLDLQNVNFLQYPTLEHPYDRNRLIPDRYNGDLLMTRLLNDEPVHANAVGAAAVVAGQEGAAEAGAAGAEGAEGSADATGAQQQAEGATPATGEAATTEQLGGVAGAEAAPEPNNILGQNAAEVTCSSGRTQ